VHIIELKFINKQSDEPQKIAQKKQAKYDLRKYINIQIIIAT